MAKYGVKRGPKPRKPHDANPSSKPLMPDYLPASAQDIWFEEIERVVQHGVNADHSSTFARYCSMEAACRAKFAAGDMPQAAMLSEVRKLSEMLGIGGLAGRTSAGNTTTLTEANPYAGLPDA